LCLTGHVSELRSTSIAEVIELLFSFGNGLRDVDSVVSSLAITGELLVGSACHLHDFEPSDVSGRDAECLYDGLSFINGLGFVDLVAGSLAIFSELLECSSCNLYDRCASESHEGRFSLGYGLSSIDGDVSSLAIIGELLEGSGCHLHDFEESLVAGRGADSLYDGSSSGNGVGDVDLVVGSLAIFSHFLVCRSCHLHDGSTYSLLSGSFGGSLFGNLLSEGFGSFGSSNFSGNFGSGLFGNFSSEGFGSS